MPRRRRGPRRPPPAPGPGSRTYADPGGPHYDHRQAKFGSPWLSTPGWHVSAEGRTCQAPFAGSARPGGDVIVAVYCGIIPYPAAGTVEESQDAMITLLLVDDRPMIRQG